MEYKKIDFYYDSLVLSLMASREFRKINPNSKTKMIRNIKDKYFLDYISIKNKQTKNLEKWIITLS